MATKTISLELDAYEKLKRAKRTPRESFSSVVRRAKFVDEPCTAREALEALRDLRRRRPESLLGDEALDRIDRRAGSRQRRERPT